MMNRAINHLVLATVDSFKKFKNKLAYYLAIFAMVFGSTFGTFNAANAVEVAIIIADTETKVAANFDLGDDPATATGATGTLDTAIGAPFTLTTFTNTVDNTTTISGDSEVTISGAITAADATTLIITLSETADLVSAGAHVETGTGVLKFNLGGLTITRSEDVASAASFDGTGTLAVTGSSSYTDSIGGATALTAITIADTKTMTIAGTGAQTLAATNINGTDTGEGILAFTNVGGTTTVTGAVGTTTLANITSVASSTVNFSGAVAATAATFTGTTTVTGAGAIPTLTIAALGDATFTTTLASTTSATIANTGTATFNGIVTTPDLTVTGTANVNVINQAVAVVTLSSTGVIQLPKTMVATAEADSVFSNTAQLGDTIDASAKVYLPSRLNGGDTINLFDDSTSTITAATLLLKVDTVVQDNALVSHAGATYSATDKTAATGIVVTATNKSDSVTATELGVDKNRARALLQARDAAIAADVATTDTAALTSIYNALYALDGQSATADTDMANQVAPQTDTISGSAVATRAMTGTVQGIVSNRMASLRSGDAFVTGMSAGNGMSANSGFIQAFGSEAEQKNDTISGATVYGYDSQTSGVAIGFDGMTETGETIGLSASYSSTDVDGKGTGKSKNNIDSYTVSVYADKATEKGYIEGSLTYGINDNTSSRLVNTAGLSRTYAGNYDSEQISLKVGGGIPNEVKDGTFVTPFASATGTIISTDSYTETSTTANDALRLKIAQDDINSLVGTIGVKAHMITDKGTPMISFAINNEFGDTTINSTNTYTGGGTAFKTSTDVEELSATLGLGYSFGNDVSSVNIGYEANANEDDYLSHYGTVKIISKF